MLYEYVHVYLSFYYDTIRYYTTEEFNVD